MPNILFQCYIVHHALLKIRIFKKALK